jgi:hypothetical protein
MSRNRVTFLTNKIDTSPMIDLIINYYILQADYYNINCIMNKCKSDIVQEI